MTARGRPDNTPRRLKVPTSDWLADTRVSYDTVAASYADQVGAALAAEPYLRAALSLLADMVHTGDGGPVADVGCGPGHVTAYLHELGVDAFGVDLSPVMIDIARRTHPGLRFEVGSMTDLPIASWRPAAARLPRRRRVTAEDAGLWWPPDEGLCPPPPA